MEGYATFPFPLHSNPLHAWPSLASALLCDSFLSRARMESYRKGAKEACSVLWTVVESLFKSQANYARCMGCSQTLSEETQPHQ